MAIIFITHDLGVVAQTADTVAVMYLGKLVEMGPVREVIRNPAHPYTKGLIAALPRVDDVDAPLTPVPGDIPSPLERPAGCVFWTRCPSNLGNLCTESVPNFISVNPTHTAACHLYRQRGGTAVIADTLISARGLSVRFPLGGGFLRPKTFVHAVEGVNIDIGKGQFYGLVGESGSGKTTLGRALLLAVPISEGEVPIFGRAKADYDLKSIGKQEIKDYRKRRPAHLPGSVRGAESQNDGSRHYRGAFGGHGHNAQP